MTKITRFVLVVCFVIAAMFSSATVSAQKLPAKGLAPFAKPEAPKIIVGLNSADQLLADLQSVLLAGGNRKEWRNLKTFLDVFLIGVNTKKPIRVDLLLQDGPMRYRFYVPVDSKNVTKFRAKNLAPIGVTTRRRGRTYYSWVLAQGGADAGPKTKGFMRDIGGYLAIAEKEAEVSKKFPNPLLPIAGPVKQYDLFLLAQNSKIAAADLKARMTWFKKIRKELEAAIQKKEGESQSAFEMRKLSSKQLYDESERIYSETADMLLAWTTDAVKNEGRFDIRVAAIPGTDLDKTIQQLGVKPTYFANIPRHKQSILSVRVNHPLDTMRQQNFLTMFGLLKKLSADEINADKTYSAADKKSRVDAVGFIHTLLSENVKKGICDAFVEAHSNPPVKGKVAKNTVLAGLRTVNGLHVDDVLKAFAKTGLPKNFKFNIAKQGKVQIHSVTVNLKKHPGLKLFFGSETLFVGTSKEHIWFAAGPNALKELQAAIQQAALPNKGAVTDPFVDIYVKVQPWLKLYHDQQGKNGNPVFRNNLLKAVAPGIDTVTLKFRRDKNEIIGQLVVKQDILRLAGNVIAKFIREKVAGGGGAGGEQSASNE